MQIDELLTRGNSHPIYCEDALFHTETAKDWIIAAVLDGCSSGTESHFASALLVKILRKSCKTIPLMQQLDPNMDLEKQSPKELGNYLLQHIFEDFKRSRKLLLANKLELLSTLILLVYNKKTKQAYLCVSGDGYFSINNEVTCIDQHNMPDYIAYHFDQTYEDWLTNQTQQFEFDSAKRIVIATDGIAKYFKEKSTKQKLDSAHHFLLGTGHSLKEKEEQLLDKQLFPFDDVAVISVKM